MRLHHFIKEIWYGPSDTQFLKVYNLNIVKISRPSRFVAALIALFSILFMQFAVAAYVCPGYQAGQMDASMTMSFDANIGNMDECQGMDVVQPSLCHAHDQAGNQSLDKPELPQVQPFVAAALASTLLPIDIAHPPLVNFVEDVQLARTTAPPRSIQHCCFRI